LRSGRPEALVTKGAPPEEREADLAREPHLSFDFSLVKAANLPGADGIGDEAFGEALERAREADDRLSRRVEAGEVGFTGLPFRVKEARALARHAARLRGQCSHLLVLGIGGSALGTKAVYEGVGGEGARRGMKLAVADNVDPDEFFPLVGSLPMKKTLVVAISKSGGTAETNAQLSVAAEALRKAVGKRWKERVVVVTDPENGLFRRMADEKGLASYPVPPNVGGRFSVLSPVGLFPLAAAGVSVERLLAGARWMESALRGRKGGENPALAAAAVYSHYMTRNVKPTHVWFTYGAGLSRVAEWWQQLWAESLGKKRADGTAVGQTPARATGVTDQHSQLQLYQDGPSDKIYTFVSWGKGRERGRIPKSGAAPGMEILGGRPLRELFDAELEGTVGALWNAGRPIVRIGIGARDEEHVGAFLQFWERVTALVGECAGIDPFDQPGVEASKKITRALMGDPGSREARERFLEAKGRIRPDVIGL
jgi:glucose-6-phosphate isomerase